MEIMDSISNLTDALLGKDEKATAKQMKKWGKKQTAKVLEKLEAVEHDDRPEKAKIIFNALAKAYKKGIENASEIVSDDE